MSEGSNPNFRIQISEIVQAASAIVSSDIVYCALAQRCCLDCDETSDEVDIVQRVVEAQPGLDMRDWPITEDAASSPFTLE